MRHNHASDRHSSASNPKNLKNGIQGGLFNTELTCQEVQLFMFIETMHVIPFYTCPPKRFISSYIVHTSELQLTMAA